MLPKHPGSLGQRAPGSWTHMYWRHKLSFCLLVAVLTSIPLPRSAPGPGTRDRIIKMAACRITAGRKESRWRPQQQ